MRMLPRRDFTRASGRAMMGLAERPKVRRSRCPSRQPTSTSPQPGGPAAPRRVIAEWEYRTAYIETFQVRLPAGLHERLREWAKQERNCRGISASRSLRRRSAAAAEPPDSVPGFTPPPTISRMPACRRATPFGGADHLRGSVR